MKRWLCIYALALSAIATNSGRAQYTYSGQFGPGTGSPEPTGATVDSSGNVYVTENYSVSKYTSSGSFISSFGSFGSAEGIATGTGNTIVVADNQSNKIFTYSSAGTLQSQFSTSGQFTGGIGVEGVTVDGAGNIYAVSRATGGVVKYSSTGTYLTTIGSYGSGAGQLLSPFGVTFDSHGNLYVADTNNSRISEFSSTGTFVRNIGSGDASFWGVAVDSQGNIFGATYTGYNVREYSSSGSFVASLTAPSGTYPFAPEGLTIGTNGTLYAVDHYNNFIDEFSPPSGVPEPSSFILCGLLASGGLGGYLWRRSRQAKIGLGAVPV